MSRTVVPLQLRIAETGETGTMREFAEMLARTARRGESKHLPSLIARISRSMYSGRKLRGWTFVRN